MTVIRALICAYMAHLRCWNLPLGQVYVRRRMNQPSRCTEESGTIPACCGIQLHCKQPLCQQPRGPVLINESGTHLYTAAMPLAKPPRSRITLICLSLAGTNGNERINQHSPLAKCQSLQSLLNPSLGCPAAVGHILALILASHIAHKLCQHRNRSQEREGGNAWQDEVNCDGMQERPWEMGQRDVAKGRVK